MDNKIGYINNEGIFLYNENYNKIKDSFIVKNLKKIQAKNMGLWNWNKMKDDIIHSKVIGDVTKTPMGILGNWYEKFDDRRPIPQKIIHPPIRRVLDIEDIDVELEAEQHRIVGELLQKRIGYGHCSTGTGKTTIIANIIAQLNLKTLIVCSGIELMTQMKSDIKDFFGIEAFTIGGPKTKQKNAYTGITIGNIDSLIKEDLTGYDLILLDECDRYLQAENRLEWLGTLNPYYMYGFTGTIKLNHVVDDVFRIYLGPKRELLQKNFIPTIHKVLTDFVYSEGELTDLKDFHLLKAELYSDEQRNNLIVDTIQSTLLLRKGILFCDYIEHSNILEQKLQAKGIKTFKIIGEIKKEERAMIKQELKDIKGPCILIGSAKIIGRGFNVRDLEAGYLAVCEKFTSSISQYCGRILRQAPGKTSCDFYDFTDTGISILLNQSKSRTTTYKKEYPGCNIKYL